jgi:hypothetical protein
MRDWFQGTTNEFYQNTVDKAQTATVSVTPEEVREASRQWAKDVGWITVSDGDGPLVFQSGRQGIMNGGVELEVDTHRNRAKTDVRFEAVSHYTVFGVDKELTRVVESFADGVLSALLGAGATLENTSLGHSPHHRNHLRAREAFRKWLLRYAVVACLPVALGVGLATRQVPLIVVAILWTLGLGPFTLVMRMRTLGMRARVYMVAMWLWFALMVIVTPPFILLGLGVIHPG